MITSFRHDERKKRKRQRMLLFAFFLALIVLLLRGPIANLLSGGLVFLARPVWSLSDGIALRSSSIVSGFRDKDALAKENERLKDTLDTVAIEAYSRDALLEENRQLKEMLGRKGEYSYLLGRILSAPPVSPYDTILIDVGGADGVTVGMPVFSQGDFKVGEINRVWQKSSLVGLYSNANTQLSVTVGTSSIPAVATGQGGGTLRVILPRSVSVKDGDIVAIPAISPTFLGVVSGIERPEGSSLEALYVRLPFDLFGEHHVYVGFPKSSP
jgi:cell shape-determining protein MreC